MNPFVLGLALLGSLQSALAISGRYVHTRTAVDSADLVTQGDLLVSFETWNNMAKFLIQEVQIALLVKVHVDGVTLQEISLSL